MSAPPPPPPPIPMPPGTSEFAATALFGYVWNWALYGVLTVQLYVYSYNFPRDRLPVKLLVYGVFLVETVQTVISGVDMYYRFATGFGSLEHLIDPYLSPFVGPIFGAIVSLTVQYFFCLSCLGSEQQEVLLAMPAYLHLLYCRRYSGIHGGYLYTRTGEVC